MMKNCIKDMRKKAQLTQTQLAQRLGISQGAIQKLETGERGLDVEWMEKIAKALNCEPWELLPKEMQPNIDQNELKLINLLRELNKNQIKTDNLSDEHKAG